MNKTVYISCSITDPATGQPRDGWQKDFLEAEAKLRAMGFYVINPVDIAREVDDAFKWRFRYYGGPMNIATPCVGMNTRFMKERKKKDYGKDD